MADCAKRTSQAHPVQRNGVGKCDRAAGQTRLTDPFRTRDIGDVLAIGLRFTVEVPLPKAGMF
jgi:hypothetical protein